MTRANPTNLMLGLLVAVVLVFALTRTYADPDLWGHVRFGQDIVVAGSIPRIDPYSFTSDRPWVNHEWLAEVAMALAYKGAGTNGLVALRWTLVGATLLVMYLATRRAGVRVPAAAALMLVIGVGVYPLLITIRPQLFSVLCFSIQLALMLEGARGRLRLWLWLTPLFAVWANAHGGWIVGLGVLGLWSACAAATKVIPRRWAAGGVLCATLGSLATPYGLELWRFLWETVGLDRGDIREWQPLWATPIVFPLWGLGAGVAASSVWRSRGASFLAPQLAVLALGLLSLRVVRLEGFFVLAAVALSGPSFVGFGPERLPLSRPPSWTELGATGAMGAAGILAAVLSVAPRAGCIALPDLTPTAAAWALEPEAISFFRDNRLQGRLLSWFDYGETAIWFFAPDLRVSMDGRRETVYSDAVRKDHLRFYANRKDASYARRIGADYVWLPQRLPVNAALASDGWHPVFRGSRSVIYAREPGTYTQPREWTGPRCFPGP